MPRRQRQCRRCHATMLHRLVEHPYWHQTTLVALVQNVPCWVCQLCGFHVFDPKVETTLRLIVKDYIRIGGLFPIPSTPYRDVSVS